MSDAPPRADVRLTLASRVGRRSTEMRVGRGLLERLPELVARHAPAHAYAVVSDETVAELHGQRVADTLRQTGADTTLLRFPAGETSKTVDRWTELLEGFAAMGLGRDGCVVAVGGGVTGDLAGFAAAAYARGVALVQVPTSLLAMIDASIGGKTGIDLRAGKNLAGAFHDPALVLADPAVLDTLPLEELRAGLAEAVKHGAIADAGYLDHLKDAAAAILDREAEALDRVVVGSVSIKTGVVERDAREKGERAMLNFGHTVAHGIEWATGYAVAHGHAVAMGLVVEAMIGERVGATEAGTADSLREALAALGLPLGPPAHLDARDILDAARSDKKAREGRVHYALIARPGAPATTADGAWTRPVPDADAAAAIEAATAAAERRNR